MSVARIVTAVALLVAATTIAFAEDKAPAKTVEELDQRIAKLLTDAHVPGTSITLIENGSVVLAKGYGVSDLAAQTPVTTDTVFRAGSISKSITAIAVMMLVEEGKIDLNARLADLAPEIKFDNPWEATDPVRVVHLLEHTTGFNDIRYPHYLLQGDVPLLQAVEAYGPYRSRWKPGLYPSYSNAPPVIAGYLVEKVSGMSFAEFTRERIFEPLGMTTARWTPAPDIASHLSKSYARDGATEEPYMDIVGKPAGSLNITSNDLAKFALFLINRGSVDGKQLLKPESVARVEATTSTLASQLGLKEGYGLGNLTAPGEKAVFRGHNGSIDGFAAIYVYNAEHKAGVVMMTNCGLAATTEAFDAAIAYLERDWPKPAIVDIKPSAAELEGLAGYYQTITPRVALLAPIDHLFGWTPVEVKDGVLHVNGTPRHAVAPRLFQKENAAAPNIVFAETPDGPLLLTALGADRRVPTAELVVKGLGAALYLAMLPFALICAFVWLIGLLRGKLGERGGVLVRLAPTLALIAPALLLVLYMSYAVGGAATTLNNLGTQSVGAQTLMYTSYAIPVLALLSLAVAVMARGAPGWVRGFAIVAALLGLGVTAFLWPYGWIGVQTWA